MLTISGLVDGCPTRHDIHNSRASWLSISILMLSIYSTIFSGIWLILAIVQPRYGRTIHSGGKLTPTTASTLFALFAKTIELSFVTVFVTFLGQVLTRRSLVKSSRGVTIAELSMRTWVIQPGFMITHWQHLQHAALSVVGAITLTAAVVAMFYTTASDSLVSPHLKYGKSENTLMRGRVKASYANPIYIGDICQTPISKDLDPQHSSETCLSIQHAGQAYHNSVQFLATWQNISLGGTGMPSNIADRPRPNGMLYDNTTVTGSWVLPEYSDMTASYEQHKRIINNVSMSMPHAGVLSAAHDPINNILQPEELAGVGEYYLRASVVSPTINVLCANMNKSEISPLIYVEWPGANWTNSTWPPDQKIAWYAVPLLFSNPTCFLWFANLFQARIRNRRDTSLPDIPIPQLYRRRRYLPMGQYNRQTSPSLPNVAIGLQFDPQHHRRCSWRIQLPSPQISRDSGLHLMQDPLLDFA
jgi:hypothetical protein